MSDINEPAGGEPSMASRPRYFAAQGCPPVETRFQPGRSGNPKGRPKRDPELASLVDKELNRTMSVTVDGRRRTLTKREIMARQLVDRALKGDLKALAACMSMQAARAAQGKQTGEALPPSEIDLAHDEAILAALLARMTPGGDHATHA